MCLQLVHSVLNQDNQNRRYFEVLGAELVLKCRPRGSQCRAPASRDELAVLIAGVGVSVLVTACAGTYDDGGSYRISP